MSPELPKEKPHRFIDKIFDSLVSIPKSIGNTLREALDNLPLGSKGPHGTVDTIATGLVDAGKTVGEGVAEGLDQPLDMAEGA